MKGKKILAWMMAAVLAMTVCGCGLNSGGTDGDPTAEAESYVEPIPKALSKRELRAALKEFASEDPELVYLSMFPLDGISREEVARFYTTNYYLSSREIANLSEMRAYLEKIAEGMPSLTTLYLGIRPDLLDILELFSAKEYGEMMSAHPDLHVVLVPAFPSVNYWTGISEERCAEVLDAYETCLNTIAGSGVDAYCFGTARWLVETPVMYEQEFSVRDPEAIRVMAMLDRYYGYQITVENGQALADDLREMVAEYRSGVDEPDLSDQTVVIFGDSIFGLFRGGTGTEKFLEYHTGATVYNLAVGGMTCADLEEPFPTFQDQIALTREETWEGQTEPEDAAEEYAEARSFLADSTGENVTFVIEFGLNDVLAGAEMGSPDSVDPQTTLGALRCGIEKLGADYPDAKILVLAPGIALSSIIASDELTACREGIMATAEACGAEGKDLAAELGLTEENLSYYFQDGLHYNERGRYLMARKLAEWISGSQE